MRSTDQTGDHRGIYVSPHTTLARHRHGIAICIGVAPSSEADWISDPPHANHAWPRDRTIDNTVDHLEMGPAPSHCHVRHVVHQHDADRHRAAADCCGWCIPCTIQRSACSRPGSRWEETHPHCPSGAPYLGPHGARYLSSLHVARSSLHRYTCLASLLGHDGASLASNDHRWDAYDAPDTHVTSTVSDASQRAHARPAMLEFNGHGR